MIYFQENTNDYHEKLVSKNRVIGPIKKVILDFWTHSCTFSVDPSTEQIQILILLLGASK